jgi:hypothetical protein
MEDKAINRGSQTLFIVLKTPENKGNTENKKKKNKKVVGLSRLFIFTRTESDAVTTANNNNKLLKTTTNC